MRWFTVARNTLISFLCRAWAGLDKLADKMFGDVFTGERMSADAQVVRRIIGRDMFK